MSTLHNFSRYFTISVERYENHCMGGILYQGGRAPGILFDNFLEMSLHMDNIFNQMSCPKRVLSERGFCGRKALQPTVRGWPTYKNGELATFLVYVKYRNYATWQGEITWLEGGKKESFESFLQMLLLINQVLGGSHMERTNANETNKNQIEENETNICQIAVDSFKNGLLAGHAQNPYLNRIEEFHGVMRLAEAMENLIEIRITDAENPVTQLDGGNIITDKVFRAYRLGGKKATFLIKILFREHSTWQGTIYWREAGEKQSFRSFMEMIYLIASADGNADSKNEYEDRSYMDNSSRKLVQG